MSVDVFLRRENTLTQHSYMATNDGGYPAKFCFREAIHISSSLPSNVIVSASSSRVRSYETVISELRGNPVQYNGHFDLRRSFRAARPNESRLGFDLIPKLISLSKRTRLDLRLRLVDPE